MAHLFANGSAPGTAKLEIMAKYGVARWYNIGSSYFETEFYGSVFTDGDWSTFADEAAFMAAADSDAAGVAALISTNPSIRYVTLDIENDVHYRCVSKTPDDPIDPGTGPPTATDLSRLAYILNACRTADPTRKWAYYELPERNYYSPVNGVQQYIDDWYDRTDLVQDVYDASDFLAPSVYLFPSNASTQNLIDYGGANVYNALRVAEVAGGIPVCPITTNNFQTGGAVVTAANWADFIPALWAASETSWTGATGSKRMKYLFGWNGPSITTSAFDFFWKHNAGNSPQAAPTALV